MNIVLTGFMASGKTAISKALNKLLSSYNLVDTDALIEETPRGYEILVPLS